MIHALLFWLIIQLLALLALPLAARLFRWLPDRGYTFAKALGLLSTSYVLWLGASTRLLYNNLGGILFAILLLAVLSAWLLYRSQQVQRDLLELFTRQSRLVLLVEVLFTACFILWLALRAYAPEKIMTAGGEKWMEIAFLNGTLNSLSFPPLDPWLSGFAISYYYFGYVMMALLTRLAAAPAAVGFEIYDALLFALTAQGAFGVVYNLAAATGLRAAHGTENPLPRKDHLTAGLFGALFVVGMGNLEGFLESLYTAGVLPQRFWEWLAIPDLATKPVTGAWVPENFMWWWTASRLLQDLNLDGLPLDKPITEFPFFSFLLGDNHPHKLALPFVLMAIGLALNLFLRQRSLTLASTGDQPTGWQRWLHVATLGSDRQLLIAAALILGSLGFLNTWDMPIYIGLAVLAWGLGEALRRQRWDSQLLLEGLVLGASLLVFAILPYFFFYISFSSQAGGVLPYIFPPTRLPQYLVMFGVQVFLVAVFLVTALLRHGGRSAWRLALRGWGMVTLVCALFFAFILAAAGLVVGMQSAAGTLGGTLQAAFGERTLPQALQTILFHRLTNPWHFLLLTALLGLALANTLLIIKAQPATGTQPAPSADLTATEPVHLFACLLAFLGLALTLSVEFVYLRDVFSLRMNTVFKFYFQGWILLSCAAAYAVWWLFARQHSADESPALAGAARLTLGGLAVLLIAAGMVYPVLSYYNRAGGFQSEPDLDGSSMQRRLNPDDFAAIAWLQTNAMFTDGEPPHILEAPGRPYASYVYEGRISAFTGFPTLLGWPGHEHQWRGEYTEPALRQPDIQTIFGTHDGQEMLTLLDQWDIDYLIFGQTELRYLVDLCNSAEFTCDPATAMRKFELFLDPVFESGDTHVYQVP